ncbi:MAG: hypothetical protein U1E35_02740 [Rhodospirillales bacterium]
MSEKLATRRHVQPNAAGAALKALPTKSGRVMNPEMIAHQAEVTGLAVPGKNPLLFI